MAFAETAKMAVRIDLEGNASAGIGKLNRQIGGLGSSIARTGKGVGQVGAGIAKAGLVAGAALVTGLGTAAKIGANFESQLNTINTIAQQTPEKLQAIGQGIRQLARDNGTSLDDLTQAYYDLLSAGVKVTDAQGVLNQAVQLSVGTLGSTSQAVDVLTTALNAYGLEGSEATRISGELAVAVRDGKVTLDQIAPSYANVAAIAAQAGIGTDEIAAAYGRLTAQGVPASEVTTQMSRAILELIKPNKQLNKIQAETGINFAKLAKEKGLVYSLQTLRDAAKEAGVPFVDLFGRVEGYKFALQTTGKNNKAFVKELDAIHNSAGVLAAQVGAKQQGLAFQFGRLSAFAKDAAITLASGFLPALTRSADKLAKFLGTAENQNALKAIGEDIGKAIDEIDWDSVLRDAREFVGVLKSALSILLQVVKAVNGLPTEIKAAAAAFILANKASGGLIGRGVGNIIGGVGESVVRGLGSRVPGVGSLFAQPVFVTNWPGGIGGIGGSGVGAGAGGIAGLGVGALIAPAVAIALGTGAVTEAAKGLAKQVGFDPEHVKNPVDAAFNPIAQIANLAPLIGDLIGVIQHPPPPPPVPLPGAERKESQKALQDVRDKIEASKIAGVAETAKVLAATNVVRDKVEATKVATVSAVTQAKNATDSVRDKVETAKIAQVSAVDSNAARISATIRANRPIITTNVSVSATTVTKQTTIVRRYGPEGGSKNTTAHKKP